ATAKDNRLFEGCCSAIVPGVPWRDLSERFCLWKTVHRHFSLWR
ncbi:MAG: transposase, partial [Glaciimonas sp.]|nr:transposase [Glaciimonas sp.]